MWIDIEILHTMIIDIYLFLSEQCYIMCSLFTYLGILPNYNELVLRFILWHLGLTFILFCYSWVSWLSCCYLVVTWFVYWYEWGVTWMISWYMGVTWLIWCYIEVWSSWGPTGFPGYPPRSHGAGHSSPVSTDLTMVSGSGSECRTMAPYSPYSAMMVLFPQVFSVLRHFARRFWNHTCRDGKNVSVILYMVLQFYWSQVHNSSNLRTLESHTSSIRPERHISY